jgi:hypothetical protein
MIYSLLKDKSIFDASRSTALFLGETATKGDLVTNGYSTPFPIKTGEVSLTQYVKYATVTSTMTAGNQFNSDTDITLGDKVLYNSELYTITAKSASGTPETMTDLSAGALMPLSESGINLRSVTRIIYYNGRWYMVGDFNTADRWVVYEEGIGFLDKTSTFAAVAGATAGVVCMEVFNNFLYIATDNNKIIRTDGTTYYDVTSTFSTWLGAANVSGMVAQGDSLYIIGNGNFFRYDGVFVTDHTAAVTSGQNYIYKYEDYIACIKGATVRLWRHSTKVVEYTSTYPVNVNFWAGYQNKAIFQHTDGLLKIYDNNTHTYTASACSIDGQVLAFRQDGSYVWILTTSNKIYKYDISTDTVIDKTAFKPLNSTLKALWVNGTTVMLGGINATVAKISFPTINLYTLDKALPLLAAGY